MSFRLLLGFAWRESRFARRRLLLFLSAISLGVAALVAMRSFAGAMQDGVRDQARTLLGADAALSSRQPFSEDVEALLDSLTQRGTEISRVTSFASMALAPGSGGTRLVQVRGVDPSFPFYGTVETRPAGAWPRLADSPAAIVDPGLLMTLNAQVGEPVRLGEAEFTIAGTIVKVPGDVDISAAFAPRVFHPPLERAGDGAGAVRQPRRIRGAAPYGRCGGGRAAGG